MFKGLPEEPWPPSTDVTNEPLRPGHLGQGRPHHPVMLRIDVDSIRWSAAE
jgi:hypothetical protein